MAIGNKHNLSQMREQKALNVGCNSMSLSNPMKKSVILISLILPLVAFSQRNIFELKNTKYYSEQNKYMKDSIWRFNQIIEYNDLGTIDEESWIRLTLEVKDTINFMSVKRLDLNNDTLTIGFHFADFNVWFGSDDLCSISGNVDYVSQQAKGITLKLNLIVTNLRNQRTYVYNGERTFSRAVNIQDFYQ
jgi:hypothetical protein